MKILMILFCLLLLVGCSTSRKDFRENHIKAGEAAAIGQVTIRYNGQKRNKDCAVCLNSVNGPCQKLDDDGLVFISLPQGQGTFRRVFCHDVSGQHYNIEGATFQVKDGVTYFGAVDVDWINKGGFKAADMFGAIGAAISESKNDGTLKMSVRAGDMNKVVQEYEQQTKTKNKVNQSLVSVGR